MELPRSGDGSIWKKSLRYLEKKIYIHNTYLYIYIHVSTILEFLKNSIYPFSFCTRFYAWLHYLAAVATRCGSPDSDCKCWSWTHPNVTDKTGDNRCVFFCRKAILSGVMKGNASNCLFEPLTPQYTAHWGYYVFVSVWISASRKKFAEPCYDWLFDFVVRWILTMERKRRMRNMSSFPPVLLSNMSRVATPVHSFTLRSLPWHAYHAAVVHCICKKATVVNLAIVTLVAIFPGAQQASHSKSFHFTGRFTV